MDLTWAREVVYKHLFAYGAAFTPTSQRLERERNAESSHY